jgi:regulator of protease activity HflC (stomatin/prohibitin superfamily)
LEILLTGLGLLAAIGGIALFLFVATTKSDVTGKGASPSAIAGTAVLAFFGVGFLIATMFVHSIEAGHVGVVTSFGKVQTETLKPGLNFLPPFVNNVTDVDTRVQGINFDKLAAASREYQDVIMSGTLNVHIDQQNVVRLYQNVGLDYADKIVRPFFANLIKEVVPKYGVGEVLAHREDIRKEAVQKLADKLDDYGIVVDDVAISNIDFSEQYKQAIEAKQVAEQQVLTEQQVLNQKKIQADQIRTTAQGNADAVLIAAEAQAKANDLLQQSLTPELIQYTLIQKLAPTIQTIVLPSGQSFILDPNALIAK